MVNEQKILFLCTGNSCRSQMAEAFVNSLRSDTLTAFSAGVEPKGLDPRAITVMAEVGIDISGNSSTNVDRLMDMGFDFVITLCGHAHETCPFFPGPTKVFHHGFDDPPFLAKGITNEEEALRHYRRVRDEIREFVMGLPINIEKKQ